jgi:hypothetical protein
MHAIQIRKRFVLVKIFFFIKSKMNYLDSDEAK